MTTSCDGISAASSRRALVMCPGYHCSDIPALYLVLTRRDPPRDANVKTTCGRARPVGSASRSASRSRRGAALARMTIQRRLVRSLLALSITSTTAIGCTEPDTPLGDLDSSELVDPTPPRRLSVSGAQVLDPDGDPLVLRGYNWGAWGLAQPEDGPANAAAGANSVRIPLRWWGEWRDNVDSRDPDEEGNISPDHLDFLDKTVRWAIENHLWVTLFVDSNYGQGAP